MTFLTLTHLSSSYLSNIAKLARFEVLREERTYGVRSGIIPILSGKFDCLTSFLTEHVFGDWSNYLKFEILRHKQSQKVIAQSQLH